MADASSLGPRPPFKFPMTRAELDALSRSPFLITEDASSLGPPPPPADDDEGQGQGLDALGSFVLLDAHCYPVDRRNATTARAATRSGHPIEVTLLIARPPLPTYICVHCPALEFSEGLMLGPKVIAAEADLILLRVPVDPTYFVYRAHPQRPSLELLPRLFHHPGFQDKHVALVRRGGDDYVVAALTAASFKEPLFDLHVYRRKAKRWTSKVVSVEEPLRDSICPVPADLDDAPPHHRTSKTITLTGGTVGWADLWRGILLCNVLDENPVLHDIPLPPPARSNWDEYLVGDAYFNRDVAVNRCKSHIEYAEMEIRPQIMATPPSSDHDPSSYLEWACQKRCPTSSTSWVNDGWKANVWSMPIPVSSWHGWRPDCSVDVADLTSSNLAKHSKLLPEGTLARLFMAYPTMSIDHDVLYLLSGPNHMKLNVLVAVDLRKQSLQGVAKLDGRKDFVYGNAFFNSEISTYLNKTTGTAQVLEKALTDRQKMATRNRHRKKHVTLR